MEKLIALSFIFFSHSFVYAQTDCDANINCENVMTLCGDYDQNPPCGCNISGFFYYDFEITQPNQQITVTSTKLNGAPNNLTAGISDVTNINYTGNACQLTANDAIYIQQNTNSFTYTFTGTGTYVLAVNPKSDCPSIHIDFSPDIVCDGNNGTNAPDCENCIGSFSPEPGSKYVIGTWVKEDGAPETKTSYDLPELKVNFYDASHTITGSSVSFTAEGMIIDGWQRIENELTIPANTVYVDIELISNGGDVYFDDIRMFPFNASMKTYVYDPVNMRLAAELDERHYATFYEYNEEGQLTRIKKETERGVMTIQETKSNSSK